MWSPASRRWARRRRNWNVEKRDTVYGEDKSWVRTGHAPANMATVSEAALPIVIQAWFETVPASINHTATSTGRSG